MNTPPPSPSLLRHLLAMVYDALLVIALVFVVYALALGIQVALTDGKQEVLSPVVGRILFVVCTTGFYCAFWWRSGQTLGMQTWRIKLVSSDGGRLRVGQLLLRCAGAAVSFVFLGLGYLWKLVDRNGRYWHDYLSGTQLVLLPKSSRDSRKESDS
ncbi:RDD family protein [Haliea sp. E17]|uniref:RDD family protein n=1 Tax=Haliea sp. E17 TaxID=3401576 RepID=UPI003AADFDFA